LIISVILLIFFENRKIFMKIAIVRVKIAEVSVKIEYLLWKSTL